MLNFNNLENHCFCHIISYLPLSDFVSLPSLSSHLNILTKTCGWLSQAKTMGLDESSIKTLGAKAAIQFDLREEHFALRRFCFQITANQGMIYLNKTLSLQESDSLKAIKESPLSAVSVKEIRQIEKALFNDFDFYQSETLLNFSYTSLRRIPRANFRFDSVEGVTLNDFPLNSQIGSRHPLPKWIFQLPKLKILNLRNLGLRSIPDNIGYCSQLQELHIVNVYTKTPNHITELPKALASLNLRTLRLEGLDLASLPDVVCELSSLIYLNLSNNPRLGTLPLRISQLPQLERLHLENTGLTTWPPELLKLNRIQILCISKNHLWSIEDEVAAWLNRIRSTLNLLDASNQTNAWASEAELIFQSLNDGSRYIDY